MNMKRIGWLVAILIIVMITLTGLIMSNVEQAKYKIVESYDAVEIRDYAPMIVAEVAVIGKREEAIKQGFRVIADYIFGGNIPAKKIAMTAPVTQVKGEKIAMTAPVIQQADKDMWMVKFVMPEGYTLDTLPAPKNSSVKLKPIQGKRFAVIRFSGIADNKKLQQNEAKLLAFVKDKHLKTISTAIYAFYNPPWTLPFLRRNEVMVEVEQ